MKLITHLYFGDPSKEFSLRLAQAMLDSGADGLEIGIPYSDPVCDGTVFQAACKRALTAGINPVGVFGGIREIRERGYMQPIYVTSYYTPIFAMGEKKFVALAQQCGVQGIIVPDLLLEEQQPLRVLCEKNNLALIQFATPYTSEERFRMVTEHARDFLYCISLPTVTGKESIRPIRRIRLIRRIREMLKNTAALPLYVGFGISTPQQVRELITAGTDGIIIGSAIARIYEKNLRNPEKTLPEICSFIKTMRKATMGDSI